MNPFMVLWGGFMALCFGIGAIAIVCEYVAYRREMRRLAEKCGNGR